ncbi:MAG: transketolase [Deltaproteobacteria bacterium]|nr:MAG: transketolase [Deltaproteobacteria bacterium]
MSATIAGLAMDAVQKANSGHPGAPMGMADMATVLWNRFLKYDPDDATWPDRDRFVLSNGHASMLLYAVLHLSGQRSPHQPPLSLDDLRNFRQWGSPTAGHPEYGEAPGIETTTGPLGQGFSTAVGMALAEAWLRARFGQELVDHMTWVFAGDGCLMEGVTSEAASLAGHLGLGRLVVLYDDNHITIDGTTDLAFSEDVGARFEAMGWQVLHVDGHDRDALAAAIELARDETARPSLICCRTEIAHGAPHKANTSAAHGAPLGEEEVRLAKEALGLDPDEQFAVPAEVVAMLRARDDERRAAHAAWRQRLSESGRAEEWARYMGPPAVDTIDWPEFSAGDKLATRKASARVIQAMAASLPQLLGGSADLAGSNGSLIQGGGDVQRDRMDGRNLHFGVREHAMAAICNGLSLHGGIQPYCATFLAFHDYMRPSVRLAALMHQPVVYVYTHDSFYLGEDGPTHQPVEHLMSMRAMPNLWVVRPADANETAAAWKLALSRRDGPTALCLTRQGLPILAETAGCADKVAAGAYVLADAEGDLRCVLLATGSEVHLALAARAVLQEQGVGTRVVSMPCWEAFETLDAADRESVLPPDVPTVSIEAGSTLGWSKWADAHVGLDRFGASAPAAVLADKLGFRVQDVVDAATRLLG